MRVLLLLINFLVFMVGITSAAGIVAAMKDPRMYQSVQQHVDPPRHHTWLQRLTGRGPTEVSAVFMLVCLVHFE